MDTLHPGTRRLTKEYRKNWAQLIQKIYEVAPLTWSKCQGTSQKSPNYQWDYRWNHSPTQSQSHCYMDSKYRLDIREYRPHWTDRKKNLLKNTIPWSMHISTRDRQLSDYVLLKVGVANNPLL